MANHDTHLNAPVLVTGGTGTLGSHVVTELQRRGRAVRALSRHPRESRDGIEHVGADLDSGEGVQAALSGIEIVIHCAGSRVGDGGKAATLVRAAASAGLRHLVNVSVVGADRVPIRSRADRAMFGYFGAKREAEAAVAGSGLPWTTLRAAQFHDLVFTTAQAMARLPLIPVPAGVRFQPVESSEVATHLVDLALGEAVGLAPEMAGPQVHSLKELLRGYLRARGAHRLLVPVHVPGAAARAIRAGANLAPGSAIGCRPWDDFLAEKLGSPRGRARGVGAARLA